MRKTCKKALPLILAICVLCSQLSLTALAADARETYPENAVVVTEDTAITGGVDTLVLVDAPVRVDVAGARLTVGLFISPDAKGAVVTVAGETSIKEIVVAAAAAVKVQETAAVKTVTIDAPDAEIEVDGRVETITVSKTAEGASIVISESASVTSLKVAAPGVRAEVAGTVDSVTVTGTATGMELAVAETASVAAVTDNSGELTVSGAGADRVPITDTSHDPEEFTIPEEYGPPLASGIPEAPKAPEDSGISGNPEEPETPEQPETPPSGDSGSEDADPSDTSNPSTGETENPETPEEPETPDPSDSGGEDDDPPGTGSTISWGTIEGGKNGSVSAEGSSVTISGKIEKTTVNQQDGYWVGFSIPEGYTIALKQPAPSQETASALVPVLGEEDGFVYFAIDGLVTAAIDEAAENVEREEDERTVRITGAVLEETEITLTAANTATGVTEDLAISVSVNVRAAEKRTIPAEEISGEEENPEESCPEDLNDTGDDTESALNI